jgi:hypothetical protein
MTVASIIRLTKAGVKDDVMIATLRSRNQTFILSDDDLINLKTAGVSDAVIKVMLNPAGNGGSATAAAPVSPLSPSSPSNDSSPTPATPEPKSNNPFRRLLDSTKSAVKQGMAGAGSTPGTMAAGASLNRGPFVSIT